MLHFFLFNLLGLVAIYWGIWTATGPWRLRDEVRKTQEVLIERAVRSSFSTPNEARELGTPEHQIVIWTPQEREAFGLNDNMRFIEETEKILNPSNRLKTDDIFAWERVEPVRTAPEIRATRHGL